MNNICPQSGTALKVIPQGVSKTTGKPYDSFVVCGVKGCRGPHILDATFDASKFPTPAQPTPQPQSPRYEAPTAPTNESKDWFGYRLGVQGHINALLGNTEILGKNLDKEGIYKWIIAEAIKIEDEANKQLEAKKAFEDDLPPF